jgi:hypothetical protein
MEGDGSVEICAPLVLEVSGRQGAGSVLAIELVRRISGALLAHGVVTDSANENLTTNDFPRSLATALLGGRTSLADDFLQVCCEEISCGERLLQQTTRSLKIISRADFFSA